MKKTKNRKFDEVIFMNKFRFYLWIITTILNIVNFISLDNDYVLTIVLTIYFIIMIESIISIYLMRHNTNVILNLYKDKVVKLK